MEDEHFAEYLEKSLESIFRINSRTAHTLQSNDPSVVKKAIESTLPIKGKHFNELLVQFESNIAPYLNQNRGTNYAAYITGSGNPIGAIAEFIKAYFNQNGLKWNNSPIASELEQLMIRWVSDFCLLDGFKKGVLTSGGSMSNLMALHCALARKIPDREHNGFYSQKPLTVYCSEETHSSIERAMVFLGLGRKYLRKVPVDERFQIRIDLLETVITQDINEGYEPLALVGNAGTTNTGSIDDLEALATIAKKFNLWYHVDGAYGLPARRIPELHGAFEGIELADSIIVNPHKWMYVPFEASCVLVHEIPKAIHFSPNYLMTENADKRWESSEHTIELSKEFRALKIWFTLTYYGVDQLTGFIKQDIELTNYLAEQLQIHGFEVNPNHPLSILCFRYQDTKRSDSEIEVINQRLLLHIETDGRIFLTGTKINGSTYLRTYFGNPSRTRQNVDFMISTIIELLMIELQPE